MIVTKVIKWFLILLGILTLAAFLVNTGIITAAAQEAPQNGTETPNNASEEETEYEYVFSDSLRMIESEWNGDTFVATFEADVQSDIVVTDAGRTSENNENVEVDRETFTISSDGTTRVEFTVEESRQVTLDDGNTLLLKGHDDSIYVLPSGDWTAVAIIVASLLAFLSIVANVLWIRQLRKNKVDRVM